MDQDKSRLLVVDDDQFNRDLLARHLKKEGYTKLDFAGDGRTALELLESNNFDLVLLDIEMPDTDGITVLKALKADKQKRNIPVIMISGVEELETVVHCIELGAEDYLSKPFNPVLLRARIGASLEKKRLRDAEITLRQRAEELLNVILPARIANELQSSGQVQSKRHENIAILIGDIVNFTPYCDLHTPEAVISEVQKLAIIFESVTDKHKLEKMSSVGDSFMAVTGFNIPPVQSVLHCVRAGLELQTELESVKSDFQVRVGVHIGPVVAGVVGKKKFVYGMFGDTVNTAARMESNGRPGVVCLSGDAWDKVKNICTGESQGLVDVKGKGKMEIFFVKTVDS